MDSQRDRKGKRSSWVTPSFGNLDQSSVCSANKHGRKLKRHLRGSTSSEYKVEHSAKLWVDLYEPKSVDDLAVHKKKIQEVETWFVESLSRVKGRRLLLLTGPPGCGKTATVRVLAEAAGLHVLEWINPTSCAFALENSVFASGDFIPFVSQMAQFRDFLTRAGRYSSVCQSEKGSIRGGNVVLIEDFPNAVLRDPSEMHSVLRRYYCVPGSPLVFILTDAAQLEYSIKHLFPPELQHELSVVNISFNPVATSLLVRALARVASCYSCDKVAGSKEAIPTREALQALAEAANGDVRSAINSLQFASTKDIYHLEELFSSSPAQVKQLQRSTAKKINKTAPKRARHSEDSDHFVCVGGKDASLFLFHALGKVLYCKRGTDRGIQEPLPKHLQMYERAPLLENPEMIYNKTSTSSSNFTLYLHHNSLSFLPDISETSRAFQYFTDSDIISSEWSSRAVLDDYSASVAIRGLMHAGRSSLVSGSWRPITRSQWHTINQASIAKIQALRRLHQSTSLTSEELVTLQVPYLVKIHSTEDCNALHVHKEVGMFSNHSASRFMGEKISEADLDSSNTQYVDILKPDYAAFPHSLKMQKDGLSPISNEDESSEFFIEEIED